MDFIYLFIYFFDGGDSIVRSYYPGGNLLAQQSFV